MDDAHMHTHTCTHVHIRTYMCMYAYTHTHTYTDTHTQTHAHTLTRAQKHTHTCTHTHTHYALYPPPLLLFNPRTYSVQVISEAVHMLQVPQGDQFYRQQAWLLLQGHLTSMITTPPGEDIRAHFTNIRCPRHETLLGMLELIVGLLFFDDQARQQMTSNRHFNAMSRPSRVSSGI